MIGGIDGQNGGGERLISVRLREGCSWLLQHCNFTTVFCLASTGSDEHDGLGLQGGQSLSVADRDFRVGGTDPECLNLTSSLWEDRDKRMLQVVFANMDCLLYTSPSPRDA